MHIALIIAPYDTARRGWRAGNGPEHLLRQGLLQHLEQHGHHIASTQVIEDRPDAPPAEIRTAFELMRGVASAARQARTAGHFPIVLSGNCNVGAVGLLSALTPHPRSIFWFDAHGEANTPATTASGFLDGMGLSILLGMAWQTLAASVPGFAQVVPDTTFLLGARDLDPPEDQVLSASRVTHLTVPQVRTALSAHLDRAPLRDTLGYVHLDLDVLDPETGGQATSYPVPDGLSVSDLLDAIRLIRSRVKLGGVTLASYAPEYARNDQPQRAAFAALAACLANGA